MLNPMSRIHKSFFSFTGIASSIRWLKDIELKVVFRINPSNYQQKNTELQKPVPFAWCPSVPST